MESLLAPCTSCHKPMNGGVYRASHICPHCGFNHDTKSNDSTKNSPQETDQEEMTFRQESLSQESAKAAPSITETVIMTTKPASEYTLASNLGNIDGECGLSIKVTQDLIKDGKFVGTKSEKVKAALAQGKKHALVQLKQKATKLGGNLVAEITVTNSVKSVDAQKVNLVVKASGIAAVAELETEAVEID